MDCASISFHGSMKHLTMVIITNLAKFANSDKGRARNSKFQMRNSPGGFANTSANATRRLMPEMSAPI